MIALSSQPGRVVIRSRTTPVWIIGAIAALLIPWFALIRLAGSLPMTRFAELDCQRATGKCVLYANSEAIDEIALDRATGAELRDRRLLSAEIVLTTRDGPPFVVVPGELRARAEADVGAIRAFLADPGRARLSLRWDHGAVERWLKISLKVFPFLILVSLATISLPQVAAVDRLARTLTLRHGFRRQVHRLDAFGGVGVQTAAEDAEARARAMGARRAWLRTSLGPTTGPAMAQARRIVLLGRDGRTQPITAWMIGSEDAAPAVEALKGILGR